MSSAGISFGGLASGLDTKAIISALVAIEQRPITVLETKKTNFGKQKSLFGDLQGLLSKLTDAAKAIKTTNDFLAMKAASDDENVLTASASSTATPGTHTVKVLQLAKAQVNHTSGAASASTPNGTTLPLEFLLSVGGFDVPISTNDTSLNGIATAINEANLAVHAEVVDTGNATNPYQLVVRSTETGSTNGFSITDLSGDAAAIAVVNDLIANQQNAEDAQIQLNGGVTITRPTNQISGAIAGVTLSLKSETATNAEVTVTIATDAEEISKKVTEFVDAYNKVVDFVTGQNKVDGEGKAQGLLFGDSTLRSIRSSLRSIVGGVVSTTGNEAYQMLAQIGITSDRDGKLTFNQSKLEEALAADEQAVAAIFTDATNGIAGRLETQLDTFTDSVDGLIKTRQEGFDRLIKQTGDRIDQASRRLTLYQQQLEAKYANLETLLGRLQSQGSSLSSIGK
ncbi:MAG: flagellar filament capping protein FliD [Planctomycetota bacterium]